MSGRPRSRRAQPLRRLGQLLPLLFIALVVVLAAAAIFYFSRPASKDQAEQPETRVTVEPTQPGTTPVATGGGGEASGGWYQLYFTAPKYPDDPASHRGGPDEKLAALIDRAQRTVDVADYDFDLASVADAMVRAKGRGARVRLVTDSDTLGNTRDAAVQAAFDKLKRAGIPIVDDKRRAIMHHKFTVVDGRWVSTGSMNYTDGDAYRLNNNLIIIESPELAANFAAEFAKMFEKGQFGPTKDPAIPNPVVTVAGTRIETCFASESRCADRIVATIGQSQRSVRFLAFSFTSDPIAQAMLDRRANGVALSGIFETTGSDTAFSEYGKLKKAGVEVYTDGNPYVMHHKVIIIDERIVIFGSFNFSDNANTQNDENLLIVENPEIARAFLAEYDRILAVAKNPPKKK